MKKVKWNLRIRQPWLKNKQFHKKQSHLAAKNYKIKPEIAIQHKTLSDKELMPCKVSVLFSFSTFYRSRNPKIAPKISSLLNSVISEINFIISHVGFESTELSTPVRPLFIGVIT